MDFEINKIFFPTDFSKNAHRALPFAAEIASRAGAKLILFHASQSAMEFTPEFEEKKKKAVDEASKKFDSLIKDLRSETKYKDLEISTVLQSGHPTVGLLEKANENNCDLIVMGTKGDTGNRNVIFGSVASSIINRSELPVLAVPPQASIKDVNHITFTTDYHEGDLKALKQTVDFAKLFDSAVDVIHVAEKRSLMSELKFRGFRDLVREKIDYKEITFDIKFEYDFFPVMADHFVDNPDSLIVMIRYKKTFWEKLVQRDHSREMAFYTTVPLLVLIGS